MKMEDKANLPRVRIAVLGHVNVGKSGEFYENFKLELERVLKLRIHAFQICFIRQQNYKKNVKF